MKLKEAEALCKAVLQEFSAGKEEMCFHEFAPMKDGDKETCYLWSYFAFSGMLYRLIKAGAVSWLPVYEQVVDGFAYYRTDETHMAQNRIKYHSERGKKPGGGHDNCFFDDNIWVARNYLFAYELLHKEAYLEEAKKIVNYIYTGWNEELGGLVWNENGLTDTGTEQELERGLSANACCIIVNAWLYKLTGNNSYLDWAFRFCEFCKKTQDKETKIYYNGIYTVIENNTRAAGEVNRDLYSYNSGSMILADLYLYEITGREEYRTDAFETAQAAHLAFLTRDEKTGLTYYRDFTWFLAVLAEGYEALAACDAERTRPYFETFETSLTYAWEHYRAENGLLPHDYITGWRDNDVYDRQLLTHSGTAEIACLLVRQAENKNNSAGNPMRGRL